MLVCLSQESRHPPLPIIHLFQKLWADSSDSLSVTTVAFWVQGLSNERDRHLRQKHTHTHPGKVNDGTQDISL